MRFKASMLQQHSQLLRFTGFKKASKNLPPTQKFPEFFVKIRIFKSTVVPLFVLIALSCCTQVRARPPASLRSQETSFNLTTGHHGNEVSSKPLGLRASPLQPRRMARLPTKRRRRTFRAPKRRHHRSRSAKKPQRKQRRRKAKGKRRKRKGCKKNKMRCNRNNRKKSSKKRTKVDSTVKRVYSRSGNSFHLAVLQNGTVKGEASHKRSDYS